MALPGLTRVSPGVYRNTSGGLQGNTRVTQPVTTKPVTQTRPAGLTGAQRAEYASRLNNPNISAVDRQRILNRAPDLAGNAYKGNDLTQTNGVIGAAQDVNKTNAVLNTNLSNANVNNPYYNVTNTVDPTTGQTTQNLAFNPEIEAMNRRAMQNYGQDYNYNGAPNVDLSQFDPSNLPAMPGDFSAERQRVEDAVYNSYKRRQDQVWNDERNQFVSDMANRGIAEGSELWNKQLRDFSQRQSDSILDAQDRATQTAGDEQQRMFNMGMQTRQQGFNEAGTRYNAQRSARDAYINEMDRMRDRPFQEMSSLLSGVPQTNFNPVQSQGVDLPGLVTGLAGIKSQDMNAAKDRDLAKWQTQQTLKNRGGGGGGGGGGRSGGGQQLVPVDIPQTGGGSSPGFADYATSILGSILPGLAGGWAYGGFKV